MNIAAMTALQSENGRLSSEKPQVERASAICPKKTYTLFGKNRHLQCRAERTLNREQARP